jgi:hypothetical protein
MSLADRENGRVPPPWKATLGEETVFAEVARVETQPCGNACYAKLSG